MLIRKLDDTDWEAFRRLRLYALQDCPDAFGGCFEDEQNYSKEDWQDFLTACNMHGTFINDMLVGMMGYIFPSKFSSEAITPVSVYVLPDYRGQKINHALLETVVGDARRTTTATSVFLDHVKGNELAMKSYKAFGFERAFDVPQGLERKNGSKADLVVYKLKL